MAKSKPVSSKLPHKLNVQDKTKTKKFRIPTASSSCSDETVRKIGSLGKTSDSVGLDCPVSDNFRRWNLFGNLDASTECRAEIHV